MSLATRLTPLLREPLVQFLLAGMAIFAFFAVKGDRADTASRTIVIDAARVGQLTERWQQTWLRAPTPGEVDALIKDYIKEEVYYREAVRLGLDQDDPAVRRRLRAKMEYLTAASVESFEPSDAMLQSWLVRNAARYAGDNVVSFDQVYVGEGNAGGDADSAQRLLQRVRSDPAGRSDWRRLGARIELPASLEMAQTNAIDRRFGEGFASALAALPRGQWTGPVTSGFGLHLVRVRAVKTGSVPALADVRQDVMNDWRAATAKNREARAYQLLLDSYSITIRP